jgi:MOSC domain-containing protein YiiM
LGEAGDAPVCAKLGSHDSMRTGFYIRVLRPGTVNTGDLLELQSRPNSAVSVDLVNRAAYQMPDAAIVGRIVRAEGLAEEWKDMVSEAQSLKNAADLDYRKLEEIIARRPRWARCK